MTHPSPCSVPDWLRCLIPLETADQQAVCREHDKEYEQGGDRAARLRADLRFARKMLHARMAPDDVDRYYWGVRQYGGDHWAGGDAPGATPPRPPEETHQAP